MNKIEVVYYTDPLCCWSWCLEPVIQKLRTEFKHHISWRYCMGGLIPSWKHYTDPVNSVSRPIQMGPVWMHASAVGGIEIKSQLWFEDPPASSYPACIAVKAAQLQSTEYGEQYLNLLREACMLQGINICKNEELIKLAEQLQKTSRGFNPKVFVNDLGNGQGVKAFRQDLNEITIRRIDRFPTLLFKNGSESVVATGFRPYHILRDVISTLQEQPVKRAS